MPPDLIRKYAAKLASEWGRRVTAAEARDEIARVVAVVAGNLASCPKYRFGYHDRDDVRQQGVLHALSVLAQGRYDPSRPLENFLHVHVRNRLSNDKRDKFTRSEPPCRCCEAYAPPAEPCARWVRWNALNRSKQNLMQTLDVTAVCDDGEPNMAIADSVVDEASLNELRGRIDRGLPPELRGDFLRMVAGAPVPKARRLRVREAVSEVLGGGGCHAGQEE